MNSETTHVFEAEIPIGMKLDDRYEILEKLDAGGMGEVYQARDLKLDNRLVVVKVLKKKFLNNSWMVKKFGDEIEALSRIQHPNVATIYDRGKLLTGEPYLVMEFVKGAPRHEEHDGVVCGLAVATSVACAEPQQQLGVRAGYVDVLQQ